MRNLLSQIVAHRSGALAVLLTAAFLEAYGDSCFQSGLYRSRGIGRILLFLLGAASLALYGFVVNIPRWDFGRLLGVYVVLFFLCAQAIARVRFGQSPSLAVITGGALITVGGLIITVFGAQRSSAMAYSASSGSSIGRLIRSAGLTLLPVGFAFICTLLLQPLFPYPFLFLFFGAVMASGWFGGASAGLFAVLLSTMVVEYFFVPPVHSFSITATAEAYFAAFVLCALASSWISTAKKKSEDALHEALDHLETRVSERTAELLKTQTELAHLS